jgi:hypothetical protein
MLLNDPDWVVRYTVVQRAAPTSLACLLNDTEPDVRAAVLERLASHSLEVEGKEKTGNSI